MNKLAGLEPSEVFRFFEEICNIPHGSYNIDQISDYLVDFAKSRNLRYRQDAVKNVVIWKEGTPGYENSAPVIIQGHMDMVAVKNDGCEKDLEKEGLDLEVIDGMISAKDTSLGGDDGIALAYALAILDSDDIAHPPLEVIATVNEEVGMDGAAFLDTSDIKGRILLNVDSEAEGIFTVSCAGGLSAICSIPCSFEEGNGVLLNVKANEFKGGHSGAEIHTGRLNSNLVMGRILYRLAQYDVKLVSISGGEKDNAISKISEVSLLVQDGQAVQVCKILSDEFSVIKEEYKTVEPNMNLVLEEKPGQAVRCMTRESTQKIVSILMNMPNGIVRMNPDMPGMVQTSLNLGIVKMTEDGVEMTASLRSSSESEKHFLLDRVISFMGLFGGSVKVHGDYPGWEYMPVSRLRDVMVEAYEEQYGEKPIVEGIHAGLECGLLSAKMEGLDCVSIGPTMKDIHTTSELLDIESTKRTWTLLKNTLRKLQ